MDTRVESDLPVNGAMSPFLQIDHLSKNFGPLAALRDVSLDIARGEIHAICGENGAGKSTLVKLLTGVHRPDSGTIRIDGRPCGIANPRLAQTLGIALVAQELSLCPDLTVEDNIWLGSLAVPLLHRRTDLRRRAAAALALLGAEHIRPTALVASLSMAEQQLVEIARMLTREARLLILDEPTATLTDGEIAQIFEALRAVRRQGRSVIYITHRLAEVAAICDRVTVLRNGQLIGTEPVGALDRTRLIEMMLGRTMSEMYPAEAAPGGAPALVLRHLSVPSSVADFSLTAGRGEIVCIAGQVGSGAAEIITALAGLAHDATGSVTVHGRAIRLGSPVRAARAGIMFVSGDRAAEGVFRRLSIFDNLVATRLGEHSRLGVLRGGRLRRVAAALADKIGVDRHRLHARAEMLSGGNQQKLAFGRCLDHGERPRGANRQPGILVLNEPTRGIDVGARADIYRLMRAFCDASYAMVLASSDLEEVIGLGDVVITLYRGRQVGCYRRGEATMHQVVADITHPHSLSVGS